MEQINYNAANTSYLDNIINIIILNINKIINEY
jgi:hypothetical protein